MPLFDFHCNDCGHDFESLMKPNDPVECPRCKMRTVTKQISAPACYWINGDNGASTTPKPTRKEERRRREKRERVEQFCKNEGKWG